MKTHAFGFTLRANASEGQKRFPSSDLLIHFDAASLEFLIGAGFEPLIAHPLPVSRKLFFPEQRPIDFDACFLGKSTPHREQMLAKLKMRFSLAHGAHGLRDEEARNLMNRSRIVLNLHNEPYANFENRVVQALFCARPVISERLSGQVLQPDRDYLLFESADDLLRRVTEVLEGARVPEPAFDTPQFHIERLLSRLGIGAAVHATA